MNWTVATAETGSDLVRATGSGGTNLVVGQDGAIVRFMGTSWTGAAPLAATQELRAMWMRTRNDIWAVGRSSSGASLV
jgi:hypothetical protein